ncbi:MAG: 30S ribosomal protein S3 [Xanthomonadaceae bacterium]|nr:30S ribosomal protein S3 [Rhodospirillaceae bacterium]NIA17820.1 30S ribosomal protein S3 [Xanthomonadaceae bacterium]
MGHKINPKLFRLHSIYTWDSSWFSEKKFSKFLRDDILIKEYIKEKLKDMGIAKISIKRSGDSFELDVYSSKPGMIIGRGGAGIENLRKDIIKRFFKNAQTKNKTVINLNIKEIKSPNLSAELVAQSIVADLEKRILFKRAMKQAIEKIKKAGAQGAKVKLSGRLNGVEIARTESLSYGSLPLHTLRANIDYAFKIANTTYGVIGVKAWIYKGDIFKSKN